VKATTALALPARFGAVGAATVEAGREEATLKAAMAKVPLHLDAAERDAKIAVTRDEEAAHPTWRMRVAPEPNGDGPEPSSDPGRAAQDVFVEGPEGWYFESRKSDHPNEFLIVEVEAPGSAARADGATKIPLTVTLAQPRQSYEFKVELDPISKRP
jgi:hypothetical protein